MIEKNMLGEHALCFAWFGTHCNLSLWRVLLHEVQRHQVTQLTRCHICPPVFPDHAKNGILCIFAALARPGSLAASSFKDAPVPVLQLVLPAVIINNENGGPS